MIGNRFGMYRLYLLTHTQREIVILTAFKAFAVTPDTLEKFLRENLQVIDVHGRAQQLQTVIRLEHATDQKAIGIYLNLIRIDPRCLAIIQAAQSLGKPLADHHIIVIHWRQKIARCHCSSLIERKGNSRVGIITQQFQVSQLGCTTTAEECAGLFTVGCIINDHHLMPISSSLEDTVDTKCQHRRVGVIDRHKKRNLHRLCSAFGYCNLLECLNSAWPA